MWKNYSKSYIKHNPASRVSIMAAAFVAAMFLSLLISLGYNFWVYEVEQIVLEEGDWQARITGDVTEEELTALETFPNVEKAAVNRDLSGTETVVDVRFREANTIYQDAPMLAKHLGLGEEAVEYHSLLLSRYLIHDPKDETPPLLVTFYLGILFLVCASLVLVIHSAFELTMRARIHQLGILSSIGATPGQIRLCLLQEALFLGSLPILLGSLLGVGLGYGVIGAVNRFAANAAGRHEAVFQYHAGIFALTILAAALTVFVSAWIPAVKLSRLTPLQAIRGAEGFQLKKKRRSPVLSMLFGIEGTLAGNALKAQKKALRISNLSLVLSFLGFSVMLCFTTLSGISTRYTYFERYQDAWDVMTTVKNTDLSELGDRKELKEIPGAKDVLAYQKAGGTSVLSEDMQSEELKALGGYEAIAQKPIKDGQIQAEASFVILDDAGFLDYCSEIGIPQGLDGAVVLNRIWDNQNSNFREKQYVPFVKEEKTSRLLLSDDQAQPVEIPVLAYTQELPLLREEYANYALVYFIPLSLWKNIEGQSDGTKADTYIRVLAGDGAELEDLKALESEMTELLGKEYELQSENRIQEKISNDEMTAGMVAVLGSFCALLAVIGIANVFSNTLGFLRQRKREFAQYMSIGLTPGEMRKMFFAEAFVTAGKPLFITIPFTVIFIGFAVRASYLDPKVFWAEAPIAPILIFAAAIVGFVALAYYIGGKRILNCDLSEALRNDTLL